METLVFFSGPTTAHLAEASAVIKTCAKGSDRMTPRLNLRFSVL